MLSGRDGSRVLVTVNVAAPNMVLARWSKNCRQESDLDVGLGLS
jgi:hypothetical protein